MNQQSRENTPRSISRITQNNFTPQKSAPAVRSSRQNQTVLVRSRSQPCANEASFFSPAMVCTWANWKNRNKIPHKMPTRIFQPTAACHMAKMAVRFPVPQNVTSRSRQKPNEFFFICIPLCSDIFHVLLQKTGPAVLPSPVFSLFINMVLFLENQS